MLRNQCHRLTTHSQSDIAIYRALLSEIQSIENNLFITSMDWEDVANVVDDDNVFRRF